MALPHERELSPNDLDWFAARLSIAVYDVNRTTPEMSVLELKAVFPEIDAVSYAPNGNQIIHVGDRTLEVSPMASNEEIRVALQNPFIKTENTKLMVTPLQGIGQKLAMLKHTAESNAGKISARVDQLSTRMETATTKSLQGLDSQEKDIADIESFVTDLEKSSNA